jgi:hypothetical protein
MSDRRIKFKKNLNKLYLPIYEALCNSLGPIWQPYYGYRTAAEQDKIYNQGRTTDGPIVTRARAFESPHNYGCATDWCVWENGKPIWPDKKNKIWEEYEYACAKAGSKWGNNFGDFPHNELCISAPWKEVGKVYYKSGLVAVDEFIRQNIV